MENIKPEEKEQQLKRLIELAWCGMFHNHPHNDEKHKELEDIIESIKSYRQKTESVNLDSKLKELNKIMSDWFESNDVSFADLRYKVSNFFQENAQPQEQKQSDWISVDDRLPEFNVNVIAYGISHSSEPVIAEYIKFNKYGHVFKSDICETNFITHWQPLPTIPNK